MTNKNLSLSYYVALDADVLRQLTFLDVVASESTGFVDLQKIGDDVFKENSGFLFWFYENIAKQEKPLVKLLVNETVYREVKYSSSCLEFIRKFCYVPQIDMFNVVEKNDEATKLANAYCFGCFENGTKVISAPMKTFRNDDGKERVSRDARNMAEATREGAMFVTLNGQDYVFDKSLETENKIRRMGILNINTTMGYTQQINGSEVTPKPFTLGELVNILKHNTKDSLRFALADDSKKAKASEIMK